MEPLKDLWATIKKHPTLGVVSAVIIVVIAVWAYNRNKQSSASATTSADQTTPHGYTVVNEYYQGIPQGQKPAQHPVPHQPDSGTFEPWSSSIRAQYSLPQYHSWDVSHTGIPLRPTPGPSSTGTFLPWGSNVTVIGPAVQGTLNGPGGSTVWYPVAGGYVSAQDITGLQSIK